MSEKCPACGRGVARGDARCTRCGASLLGVELEGADLAMTGTELMVGRAVGEGSGRRLHRGSGAPRRGPDRRRRVVAAAGGTVALLVGVIAPTSTSSTSSTSRPRRSSAR